MSQTLSNTNFDRGVQSLLAQAAPVSILRGIAAVLFGLLALFVPGIALSVMIAIFGAYALIDGALSLIAAARMAGKHDPWVALLFEGVVGIAAGIIAFRTPGLTAIALLYVIATWGILTGCLEVAAAIFLRKIMPGEWGLAVSGILSIGLGCLLFAMPGIGLLALVWVVGIYAIVFGGLMIYLGAQLSHANV